jgi:hypothetical protein
MLSSKNNKTNREKKEIDHHIFNGSIALLAVCITVISLFRVTKTGAETYADEVMGVAAVFFMAAACLSYLSLRKKNEAFLERLADISFFIGLLLTILTGVVILFNI